MYLISYLGLVKTAQNKKDVTADSLNVSLMTEEASQPVHQGIAGQKLAMSQEVQDPLCN